jgi:glycosyltransferase involved in cell wall biosynthesis
MRNIPFFSIIIPTKNSEGTISNAVNSILKQSFYDYEILIIDSLSTDYTLNIIRSYNDKRILIYSQKDNGIYDAMNKGTKIAKGKYIFFLGSDDYLESDCVLEFVYSNSYYFDLIYGNVRTLNWGEKYDGFFDIQKLVNKNICHQGIFYKSKILKQIRFNTKYSVHADWALNIIMFINPYIKKTHINKVISFYSTDGFSSSNEIDYYFQKDKWKIIFISYFYAAMKAPWIFFMKDRKDFFFLLKTFVRIKINQRYPEIRINNPILNSLKYILKSKLKGN